MTLTNQRTRVVRPPIPSDAVVVRGTVPVNEVPAASGRRGSGPRRWQTLAEKVQRASIQGEWLVVTLATGYNCDVIRSGVKEELLRSKQRLDWRSQTNDDGSTTIYMYARSPEDIT